MFLLYVPFCVLNDIMVFVWYIYALFLSHTISHLSFILSSPCKEQWFLLSFFLVINCIYCLFSFLLCAFSPFSMFVPLVSC